MKSKRRQRRGLLNRLENKFDIEKLDYHIKAKALKNEARLHGLLTALGLYALGYGTAYLWWLSGGLPEERFSLLSWLLMVPCTMIAFFVWGIISGRKTHPLFQEMREYINKLEDGGGLLWRFEPLMQAYGVTDGASQRVVAQSREGRADKIAVEDYADTVLKLHAALKSQDQRVVDQETVAALERNLDVKS